MLLGRRQIDSRYPRSSGHRAEYHTCRPAGNRPRCSQRLRGRASRWPMNSKQRNCQCGGLADLRVSWTLHDEFPRGGIDASELLVKIVSRAEGGLMRQTTLSVVLEVEPASVGLLSKLIEDLKNAEVRGSGVTEPYGRLQWRVPTFHFMSMSRSPGAHPL